MKIAISGVQCTGKSTVLKELQKMPELSEYEFVFEGIRNLKNQGKIKINEDGNDYTQMVIARKMLFWTDVSWTVMHIHCIHIKKV